MAQCRRPVDVGVCVRGRDAACCLDGWTPTPHHPAMIVDELGFLSLGGRQRISDERDI